MAMVVLILGKHINIVLNTPTMDLKKVDSLTQFFQYVPIISKNCGSFLTKHSALSLFFYEGLAISYVYTYILYAKDNCH